MCDYTRLCHDYAYYCNYSDYCISHKSDNRLYFLCEHVLSKTNIRDGQHTEGIMLAKSPGSLINSVGHWHGLVVPGICTRCSNRHDVSAMNVDGMLWIELVPTDDAFEAQFYWQLFRAVCFPSSRTSTHAVQCASLSSGCNFPPVAKSMPIAPKLELNTIQKEENAQPWAYRLMDQCHGRARITSYFTIWMKNNQHIRRMSV